MTHLFINKGVWNQFSASDMADYQQQVFDHYCDKGFPYFPTDKAFRDKEFSKLMAYEGDVMESSVLRQTMHGLSLAWSYMPHSWDVVCNDKLTPLEAFNDDETFKKVIAKRISIGDNMSDNGIRKMLKMFAGVQAVSNFRPTAAAALYEHFCLAGDNVLDMSAGFGGRLLGAIKADVNYIGYDPSVRSLRGCRKIADDYGRSERTYELKRVGSELIELPSDSIDFAFTSPPYFDTEKYSNSNDQSYLKYPTQEAWLNGFLRSTFENVHDCLKAGRFMAINIANVPNFTNLESECVRIAKESGFIHTDTWKLALSKPPSKGKTGFKFEPVFIFKKGE